MSFEEEFREMLNLCSVDALIEFIEKWSKKGQYDPALAERFRESSLEVQEGSLAKIIANTKGLKKEAYYYAYMKLKKLGWSSEIK